MKKLANIRNVMIGALLALCGAGALAQAIDEVEPNFPMSAAQPLTFDSSGSASVSAFMESGSADVFSFWAKQGDVVTVDIDGGVKNVAGSTDTIVSFHHPAEPTLAGATPYRVMTWNDDAAVPDAGSMGAGDSYIANMVIPADGVYFVAVTGYMNRVLDGGVFSGAPGNATGSYTLVVSGVSPVAQAPAPAPEPELEPEPAPASDPASTPSPFPQQEMEVQKIGIDIKPGISAIARIDPKSRREIPVALLSSRDFDVRRVDVSSLTFGRTGDELSLKECNRRRIDVNRDGRRDLVCHFENQLAGFEPSDEQGIVRGRTAEGAQFEGTGALKVIAEKRKGHRWHGSERRGRDDDDGRKGHRDRRDR